MSDLTEEEANQRYTVAELVDLALHGHFVISDQAYNAIWKIYRLLGAQGRQMLNQLPDTPAYPTPADTLALESQILTVLANAQAIALARQKARTAELEKDQLKLFDE